MNDLVVVLAQKVDEFALVFVLRVEPGIGIRANQVAPLGGRFQEGDVIDVDLEPASRVVQVGNVNEDGHVLAQVSFS